MLELSIQDVKDYLGIDYTDDSIENRLNHLCRVAHLHMEGAIGKDYPKDDERVIEIALIVISDLYDNHDLNEKVSGNVRRLVNDFSMQLKLELKRGAKNDF